jgi:uncharacterized protein YjbJ (UPF0337 family)
MDKDRIKGAAQKLKGGVEKAVGKMVGSKKLETDGKIDQSAGTIRKAAGESKDAVRDVVKNRGK